MRLRKRQSAEVKQVNALRNKQRRQEETRISQVASRLTRHGFREPTPDHVWADRDRRMAVDETPNMMLLGDPTTTRWDSNA